MTPDQVATFISPLVASQFPEFYQEQGPNFIAFTRAYYEFLEQEGGVIYHSRNLRSYQDIDLTPEIFLVHFKNSYLQGIPFNAKTDKRLLVKNALDLYRAKGSEQGLKLFFQLVFGEEIDIYYPSEDIFSTSNAEWIIPEYLEVTGVPDIGNFSSRQITGVTSGATAFVDRIVRRSIHGKYVNILFITNRKGTFQANENISYVGRDFTTNPFVLGSLSSIQVAAPGDGFSEGEIVNIVSDHGGFGQGIVKKIQDVTGIVDFEFVDGGFGFTANSNVNISQNILYLSNLTFSNTSLNHEFYSYEKLIQPLNKIVYSTMAGGTLAVGDIIENYYPNNAVVANGSVLSVNTSTKTIIYIPNSGNIAYDATFSKQGNSVTLTINTYADITASGTIMGMDKFKTVDVTGNNFIIGEQVNSFYANGFPSGNGAVSSIIKNGANSTLKIASSNGVFYPGNSVKGSQSSANAQIVTLKASVGLISEVNQFVYYPNNYVYGAYSNTRAYANSESTGSLASFSISGVNQTETVVICTDLLSGNNVGLIPYLNILGSGTNSNVSSNGYGFPRWPQGGLNDPVIKYITLLQEDVGVITGITGINPGIDYNVNPIVDVIEKPVAGKQLFDYSIGFTNASSHFVPGEIITQQVPYNDWLKIHTPTTANTFLLGEILYQSNGTANTALGVLEFQSGNTLTVGYSNGAWNNTANVHGSLSNTNIGVTAVDSNTFYKTAKGMVKTLSGNNMSVKRLSINQSFDLLPNSNGFITGQSSGATANLVFVIADLGSNVSGDNATISANVTSASGSVGDLGVFSSGFGHIDGEVATFFSKDGTHGGSLILSCDTQGHSEGYFRQIGGATSGGKYLQDNYFYQQYSYEVLSSINIDSYVNVLKNVMHTAGWQLFGSINKSFTTDELSVDVADFSISSS